MEYFSISFDYDGTLTTARGYDLAMQKKRKNTLYIISARSSKEGMLKTAKLLGIPNDHVFAVGSNKKKIEKIKELNIEKHYDNNPDVIKQLSNGILVK